MLAWKRDSLAAAAPAVMWIISVAMLVLGVWKMVCEYLRSRRAKLLAKLDSVRDCHIIHSNTLFVEFPFLYRCAFESGVMRAAGIPEIIAMFGLHNAAKQYDDMDILVREMLLHHADSPRGSLAIRRLNFLHSFYRIANDDYLYMLANYVVNFIHWTDLYGYRKMTELEQDCHYKVWHDIATRMGIRNIPLTIAELARFRDEYEVKRMRYRKCNHVFAEAGMKLMLGEVPRVCKPLVRKLLLSVLDARLLAALGFPQQPSWLSFVAHSVLTLHKVIVRWMPPRPLHSAHTRIFPSTSVWIPGGSGCPMLSTSLDGRLPLSYHRFKPCFYQKGYKIAELGGLKPGRIGDAFYGDDLLCPLRYPHAGQAVASTLAQSRN